MRLIATGRARLAGLVLLNLSIAGMLSGCGSGDTPLGSGSTPPPAQANSKVTVALSSAANDQLSEFQLEVQSLTLTSTAGKTVTLLSQPQAAEFIHLNGGLEPFLTVDVPQDVYSAATVVVGSAQFKCVVLDQAAAINIGNFDYGTTPSANVSVTLPTPITVSGDSMGLVLTLLVSKSASYSGCPGGGSGSTYTIAPTFNLTPLAIASQPTTPANGAVTSLDGQIGTVDTGATGFELLLPTYLLQPATTLHVTVDNATVWQGVSNATGLVAGRFVDLDGMLQSADGSLLATRIAVQDPAAVDVQRGPILFVSNSATPILDMDPRQAQGKDAPVDYETFNFAGATFQVSGQLNTPQSLPFVPNFSASSLVPGQSVYISTPAFVTSGPYFAAATTITLMPQTIDGTIVSSSSSGNFTVYSVALGAYDLFSALAIQPGQTTLLTDPNHVEVYVGGQTLMLNSSVAGVGSTLRFYGLVFEDNGVLRMECAQVSDGVAL